MNQRNARIALLVSFTAFVVLVVWQRVPTPELLIGDSSRTQLDTQRPNILFLMSDSQVGLAKASFVVHIHTQRETNLPPWPCRDAMQQIGG